MRNKRRNPLLFDLLFITSLLLSFLSLSQGVKQSSICITSPIHNLQTTPLPHQNLSPFSSRVQELTETSPLLPPSGGFSSSSPSSQLVIARCRESLLWLTEEIDSFDSVIIYNKCNVSIGVNFPPHVIIFSHPNIGSCDAVYLSHILIFWNDLADNTIFYKGTKDSHPPSSLLSSLTSRLDKSGTPTFPLPSFVCSHPFARTQPEVEEKLKLQNYRRHLFGGRKKKMLLLKKTSRALPPSPFPISLTNSPWRFLSPFFSVHTLSHNHSRSNLLFSNDPLSGSLNLSHHSSPLLMGEFVEGVVGREEKERFFGGDTRVCLKGYFGVKKERVRWNVWELYAGLRREQKYPVEEVDHFIERMWDRMFTMEPPLTKKLCQQNPPRRGPPTKHRF